MSIIKVLIVDDSALVRQTYKLLLESDPEIQVIGTAGDPYIAVQKIQREKPDVITLDIEMPRMDGLTFLKKIMLQAPMPVIVITDQTLSGANIAVKALEIGAVDVLSKPHVSNEREMEESKILLIDKVKSAFHAKKSKDQKSERSSSSLKNYKDASPLFKSAKYTTNTVIAIGASTGGTEAIKTFLSALPREMPPILIVQHMPEKFTASFAKRLNDFCALRVKEAEDNEPVLRNTVYIAPGDHHMAIKNCNGKSVIRIFKGDLVNRHRPSVNVLFNSIAAVKGRQAIGIIMTGMGDDGATGMLAMHQNGAYTIAQDEASSVVFGMPHKAILAGGVSNVIPLADISGEICELVFQQNDISDQQVFKNIN
jgi:two-component system, chemotaxis family, protein-glutamate methylesterase/glutaminase